MKKVLSIVLLFCLKQINAQTCQASFTYSQGTAGTVTFTSTSSGAAANTTYFWNWDDSYAQVGSSSCWHTFYYNGSYAVSLTISDSVTGCYSTITNTVVVTTAAPCNINASFGISIDTVTSMVTFTNTSTGLGPNATYTLNAGNGTASMGSGQYWATVTNFPYIGQYVATLTVSGGGCTSTFSDTFDITNGLTCNLAVGFTDTLRNNGQVDFYNTSTGVLSNMNAIWYYGDGTLPDTVNTANHSHNYLYNGTYHVKLYMLDYYHQCRDSISTVVTVTNAINPATCATTPSFTITPDSSQAHAWFAMPTYSPYATSAVWSWGDGSFSTGFYPSHTYASAGTYNICLKVYFSCGDSSTSCLTYTLSKNSSANQIVQITVVHNTTGISQNANVNTQTNLYPNPTQNNFIIETNISENELLQMYDINGNFVLSQIVNTKAIIDVSNLMSGIYNVRILTSNGIVNKRLVIVR